MIEKHKATRVRGEPRDFIDCYLDELDMVCVYYSRNSLNVQYFGFHSVRSNCVGRPTVDTGTNHLPETYRFLDVDLDPQ